MEAPDPEQIDVKPGDSVLVEVSPGDFAIFGGLNIEGEAVEAGPLLPAGAIQSFENEISSALAAGNLGVQITSSLGAFEGLVRLSPETLQALSAGATPMTSGAVNLGSLVNSSGQIVHSVQWTAAGATGLASALTTLGPAVAIMAIQMQLAKISSLVKENLMLSDAILEEIRTEHWSEVEGYHSALIDMIGEAQSIGMVNQHIWQNVLGYEGPLQKIRANFRRKVQGHIAGLHSSGKPLETRKFLDHHGDAILRDVQGLLQAQAAWYTYQAIRAGHMYSMMDSDPSLSAHLETVIKKAQEQHDADLRKSAELVDALLRRASAMVEAKGSSLIPFGWGKKNRAAKDVAAAGRKLRKLLVSLHTDWHLEDPPVPRPRVAVCPDGSAPKKVLRTIRWHLHKGEQLLAIASVRDQSRTRSPWDWTFQDAWLWLAVTNERILVARKKDFAAKGEIAAAIPIEDVRYVRSQRAKAKVPARLEVVTADRDLIVRFSKDTYKKRDDHIDQFTRHMKSLMTLPDSEVPMSPMAVKGQLTSATPDHQGN